MAPAESVEMSMPRRRMAPALGSISRTIMRASVDFPQPDSPTIPSVSRSRSVNDTPSTACTCAHRAAEYSAAHRKMLDQVLDREQRRAVRLRLVRARQASTAVPRVRRMPAGREMAG